MAEIKEYSYSELKKNWNEFENVITLIYTPTCGTCQLAKKMLMIVAEASPQIMVNQINLNTNQQLAIDFEIFSIPCLVIHQNNICIDKIYKFQSVPHLYELINSYFQERI